MDFSNINVIVTGASNGIGKCLCKILHENGATVIGVYNKNKINGVLYDTYKCDIRNEEEIKSLYQYVKDRHEKIDIIINCAAISMDCDILEKTKDEFMQVLEVNLVGTFLMCKYAALNMDKGVIINMASTDAIDTFSTISMDYSSSKAGVINLTKNLALRFPNLKICALAPNWVDTESVLNADISYIESEMKRIGQKSLIRKEEVALKIIEIIINDDYISGDVIRMDGLDE